MTRRVLDTLCQVLDGARLPAGFTAAQLWLDVLHAAPPVMQRTLFVPQSITRQMLLGESP